MAPQAYALVRVALGIDSSLFRDLEADNFSVPEPRFSQRGHRWLHDTGHLADRKGSSL